MKVLVLDPRDDGFFQRAEKEGDVVGRVFTEFEATMAGLHDIVHKLGGSPDLEIGLHKHPYCALVVGYDGDPRLGGMQVNVYPYEGGVRGLTGKTYRFGNGDPDLWTPGMAYFDGLAGASDIVKAEGLPDFRKELGQIRQRKYGI